MSLDPNLGGCILEATLTSKSARNSAAKNTSESPTGQEKGTNTGKDPFVACSSALKDSTPV